MLVLPSYASWLLFPQVVCSQIPMHRKWVRLKCASHMLHDAPLMFQFLSFMWASLSSSCLARKALKKSACWETTQFYFCFLIFGFLVINNLSSLCLYVFLCFKLVFLPIRTFRIAYGDSCVDPAENQKLLHPVN